MYLNADAIAKAERMAFSVARSCYPELTVATDNSAGANQVFNAIGTLNHM